MNAKAHHVRRNVLACWLIICSLWQSRPASGQNAADANAQVAGDYVCVQRAANSKVWQKKTFLTNDVGGVATNLESYTELATGLCYIDPNSGQYVDSVEEIVPVPGGAQAVQGRHQVQWTVNANTPGGAVMVATPDGKLLSSTVFGIAYYDVVTGSNAAVAQLQDSTGSIAGPNQVIYEDAFSNLTADLCYTFTKAGLSQNVVLRQSPQPPHSYGLSDDNTIVQIYTEFFNSPSPEITAFTNNNAVDDRVLDFGEMKMGIGHALFENSDGASINEGTVQKQWVQFDNRTFLIESVPYHSVSNQLKQLPQASNLNPKLGTIRRTAFMDSQPSRRTNPKTKAGKMKLALTKTSEPRLVVDYELLSSSGYCTLQGDTTYLVSGTVNITDALTIEGGAVIKYTNNGLGCIQVSGSYQDIVCLTGPYRPAIFTSMSDDSVGEKISGSSGVPTKTSTYIYFQVVSTQSMVLSNLRLSYAQMAISGDFITNGGSSTNSLKLWDCQFCNCGTAIYSYVQIAVTLYLYNTLLSGVTNGVVAGYDTNGGARLSVAAVNVTADNVGTFAQGNSVTTTNCIFTSVSALSGISSSFDCYTNASTSGVYQTNGAGRYYLPIGGLDANIGAGTTNVDPTLLKDLQARTTSSPVDLSGWITTNIDLVTQNFLDNTSPNVVNRGYHYPLIDYALNISVSNATVTASSGVVLAGFGQYGIQLWTNGIFFSSATATNTNCIVRYNTVQEQSNTNWTSTNWLGLILGPSQQDSSTATLFFTQLSVLADDLQINGSNYPFPVALEDCQLYSGEIYDPAILSANSLYQRVQLDLFDPIPLTESFYNSLFLEGSLTATHTNSGTWTFRDNLFDQTSNTQTGSVNVCSHNAYVTNFTQLTPTNSDVILVGSPAYETGPLGPNYYPTNLTQLIHNGSESAPSAGLYHYTVTTNNSTDGTGTVSIGFHYVAVGTGGLPLVSDSAGIPDYLDDASGDGALNTGGVPPANGTTYYVDTSGSDSLDGLSVSTAFATPQKAVSEAGSSSAANPVTLEFKGGDIFNTNLDLASGYLTLTSYGGGKATFITTNSAGISINNVGNILISNLIIFGNTNFVSENSSSVAPHGVAYNGIDIGNSVAATVVSNLTVVNCEIALFWFGINGFVGYNDSSVNNIDIIGNAIHDCSYDGISLYNSAMPNGVYNYTNANIIGNTISNIYGVENSTSGLGVLLSFCENGIVATNTCHDTAINSGGLGAVGIQAYYCDNVDVLGNEVYHVYATESNGLGGNGIDLDIAAQNSVVEYNYVHDCQSGGLLAYHSGSNCVFRFNVSINTATMNGHGEFFMQSSLFKNLQFYNNTLISAIAVNQAIAATASEFNMYGTNNVIANNVLVGLQSGSDYYLEKYQLDNSTLAGTLYMNGDLAYCVDGGGPQVEWNAPGNGFYAWSSLPGSLGFEVNGRNANASLYSYTAVTLGNASLLSGLTNFQPTNTLAFQSAAIGNALNLLTTYGISNGGRDFLGNTVPASGYNIGAYNNSTH